MNALKRFGIFSLFFVAAYVSFATHSFAENYENPACLVTIDNDTLVDGTLRDVFENVLNNNSAGGCNISEVIKDEEGTVLYDFADRMVADNLVMFYTPEACEENECSAPTVSYIKIDRHLQKNLETNRITINPDPLEINPKQSVMLGNLSKNAIEEMETFYLAGGNELHEGYQYIIEEELDYGSVILDLTAFDTAPEGQTGIICGNSEDSNGTDSGWTRLTYLRNIGIVSGKFDSEDDFFAAHPCLQNAGGNQFCKGTVIPSSGTVEEGNANYDDVKIQGDPAAWCKPACTTQTVYIDADYDTYGDANATLENGDAIEYCTDDVFPAGYSSTNDDCDDSNDQVHPGQNYDDCGGEDLDCNGDVSTYGDENKTPPDAPTYYADTDADTFGDDDVPLSSCEQPDGFVLDNGDCDDSSAEIHPGATDVCNAEGIDYDCDGTLMTGTDWYVDADADTYGDPMAATTNACEQPAGYTADATDCLDTDASVHPGATDECNDGVDQDCDGYDLTSCVETCTDGIDNDGNGATDCYDAACSGDSACTVSAEICDDGLDNDFNTLTDCADAACSTWSDCHGGDLVEVCDDQIDNDADSATDCTDADCAFADACLLDDIEENCQDAVDDDADTYTDCFDIDCTDVIVFEGTDANGSAVSLTCMDMLDIDSTCKTYSSTDDDGDGLPECLDAIVNEPPPAAQASGGCATNCDLNAKSQMTETQLVMSVGLLFSMILIVSSMRRRLENREKARGL